MKNQTCCFIGHRIIPENEYWGLKERLDLAIMALIGQGVCYFAAGGALGFDTMAAFSVLKLRIKYPHIKLILVLPCKRQAENWCEQDKNIYALILQEANKVVYASEHYDRTCMAKRNRYMVDKSSYCICYLAKDRGGTAYTVGYAKQKGLQILNLAVDKNASSEEESQHPARLL